jgi:hypothetical protein
VGHEANVANLVQQRAGFSPNGGVSFPKRKRLLLASITIVLLANGTYLVDRPSSSANYATDSLFRRHCRDNCDIVTTLKPQLFLAPASTENLLSSTVDYDIHAISATVAHPDC